MSPGRFDFLEIGQRRQPLARAEQGAAAPSVGRVRFRVKEIIGGHGHELGEFCCPGGLAVDRQGNLYVADTWNYRVQVLDPAGNFLRAFGAQGDRPGEFIRPKGIAVDSEGHVYVADAEFNNFQVLSPEGQPLLAVGELGAAPGQFMLIAGLHIDAKDRIYTTEMYAGRIQVFQYIAQPPSVEGKGVVKARNH